jgi:glycosyltransferase involved in cell wall biosynthesis
MALGHNATVFVARFHHLLETPGSLPVEMSVDGVRYISLDARPYHENGFKRLLNIIDYCRGVAELTDGKPVDLTAPDAIIVTSPHPFAIYPASRLARRYGAVLVFEVRDLWSLSIRKTTGASRAHPFVLLCRHAEGFAYRHADLAASLLANAEDYMKQRGLPSGRFVHVPNGVDLQNPQLPRAPADGQGFAAARLVAKWKAQGRSVLIHPGAVGPANALDRLLDAVAVLNGNGGDAFLGVLVVGNGSMVAQLKEQAQKLELKNVAFYDHVPKAEALWLTGQCDIGYAGGRDHSALYHHGLSFNKIMDFMQAGLPVVLPFPVTGDPISSSGGGVVTGTDRPIEIAHAIGTLAAATPEERHAMGAKGKMALHRFDYRHIASDYAEAILRARSPH